MRLNISVTGADAAAKRLAALDVRLLDARPAFETIVGDLLQDEKARFDTAGYGRWPRLDPDTIRRKSKLGHDPRILQATGTLRRALTERHAPGQRLDIGRSELRFGLVQNGAAYYGRFHQTGRGVPKRIVLSVTPTRRRSITERVRRFIVNNEVRL